nr:aliphatic sulfonate ABC transporter substrate-binding protein [Roseococcus pinisoli]
MNVGNQRSTLRALLEGAGQLDGLPYTIDWKEFIAAQPILEAMQADAVDIAQIGDINLFSVASFGAPFKGIATTRSTGASHALIVPQNSTLRSVADLRGKNIASVRGGWTHYSMLRILEAHGLKARDVRVSWINPADSALAFRAGQIDAWSVWGALTSIEVQQYGARILATAENLVPAAAFTTVKASAIPAKRELFQDFSRRVDRATAWGLENPAEYARLTAALIRQPAEALEWTFRVDRVRATPLDDAALRGYQDQADKLLEYGIINRSIRVTDIIDRSFTPSA